MEGYKIYFGLFLIFTYADLYGQSITVISPNGGEIWKRGKWCTITWASSGAVGNETTGERNVCLEKEDFYF